MGGAPGPAAPLVLILIALLADALLAGLPGLRTAFAVPMAGFGAVAAWFDAKLNRARRGAGALRLRGALVALVIAGLGWGIGALIVAAAGALAEGWVLLALVLASMLAQRRPFEAARRAARALQDGRLAAARRAVAPLARHDSQALDAHGAARAAIEGLAGRFAGGLVGALFWFLLAGLPGLLAVRALAAAADAIGKPSARHAAFGAACARLDDALTLIPAALAGPILAFAAMFVPGASPAGALALWGRDLAERGLRGGYRAEGAVAGTLGLALGGPRRWDGETRADAWIGDGRARAEPGDVRRALWLAAVADLIVFLLAAAALAAVAR